MTTDAFAEDYEKKPVETKHYIVADEMTDWGLPNKLVCYCVRCEVIGNIHDNPELRFKEGST